MTVLSPVPAVERIWERPLAILLSVLAVAYALAWVGDKAAQIRHAERRADLSMRAVLPVDGGWISDPLQVVAGQPVRLRIVGVEGVHGLGIARTDIETPLILPGQETILDFVAPAAGRYVIHCTVWCGRDHWRMRTVLEVTQPYHPDQPIVYGQDPLRYAFSVDRLGIDNPHPAAITPSTRPDPVQGSQVWTRLAAQLDPQVDPAGLLMTAGWPLIAPDAFVQSLAADEVSALKIPIGLTGGERWDLTAFLWQQMVTPESLALGQRLYSRDCASCHGESGGGDGFDAGSATGTVANFQDGATTLGASPALYYAKIARGGMGTGMPNWGTVYSEDELWAVVDVLMGFQFDPILGLPAGPATMEHP